MSIILTDVYHVGDSGCSVFLVDTRSNDGLVLIDAGMSLPMIQSIYKFGLNVKDIEHCILTHFHIDHIAACSDLKRLNKHIKFYAHDLDADAIEERGHGTKTAASWYGVDYKPVKLEMRFKEEIVTLKFGKLEFQCIHTPGHTPGSISVLVEVEGKKVLFGQDIHGPFMKTFGSDLNAYQDSMKKLLELNADILCEGHFGVFQPAEAVHRYIKSYMERNKP